MAVARLPEPAREDISGRVIFPLENKSFVMEEMHFEIVEDDGFVATLAPVYVSILHSDVRIDLQDRLTAIATDVKNIDRIKSSLPDLAGAIDAHWREVQKGVNSSNIRRLADRVTGLQTSRFGKTNAASATTALDFDSRPASDLEEEISGVEGRLLVRIHSYKERDRSLSKRAKDHYRKKGGGKLICTACGLDPCALYGDRGDHSIEAHHTTPIEELQPDTVVTVSDLAMVCASCHRIIHSKKPCLTVEDVVPN